MTVLRGSEGQILVLGFPDAWKQVNDLNRMIAEFIDHAPGTPYGLAVAVFPGDKLPEARTILAEFLESVEAEAGEAGADWTVVVP